MRFFFLSPLLLLCLLLSHCASHPPAETLPQKSTVIVVHGIFASEVTMRPLRNALTAQGIATLSPSLRPSDGSAGLDELAAQLRDYIDARLPERAPIQIVAHSMGGLISHYYLEELGGKDRCRAFYTMASPHHGTPFAKIHPGPAGRQMEPGSSFTKKLLNIVRPAYPVTCYRSSTDLVILPSESATLPYADNVLIRSPGHIYLTKDRDLTRDLTARIKAIDERALSAARSF